MVEITPNTMQTFAMNLSVLDYSIENLKVLEYFNIIFKNFKIQYLSVAPNNDHALLKINKKGVEFHVYKSTVTKHSDDYIINNSNVCDFSNRIHWRVCWYCDYF